MLHQTLTHTDEEVTHAVRHFQLPAIDKSQNVEVDVTVLLSVRSSAEDIEGGYEPICLSFGQNNGKSLVIYPQTKENTP